MSLVCPCCHTDLEAFYRERAARPVSAYKLSEVADMLGIGQTTLDKIIDKGEIHVVRMTPDTPRILRSEVERFIAEKQEAEAWESQPPSVKDYFGAGKNGRNGPPARAGSRTRNGRKSG